MFRLLQNKPKLPPVIWVRTNAEGSVIWGNIHFSERIMNWFDNGRGMVVFSVTESQKFGASPLPGMQCCSWTFIWFGLVSLMKAIAKYNLKSKVNLGHKFGLSQLRTGVLTYWVAHLNDHLFMNIYWYSYMSCTGLECLKNVSFIITQVLWGQLIRRWLPLRNSLLLHRVTLPACYFSTGLLWQFWAFYGSMMNFRIYLF